LYLWRVWVVDLDLEEVLDSLLRAARLAWRWFPGALPAPWIRPIPKDEAELNGLRETVPAGGGGKLLPQIPGILWWIGG
jgi:hypothetical protein